MYSELISLLCSITLFRRILSGDIEENGDERIQKANGIYSSASLGSVDSAADNVSKAMVPLFEGLKSFSKTMKIYYGVLSIGSSSNKKILDSQRAPEISPATV